MEIKTLEQRLQTIDQMLNVMNEIKNVYFPEREDKDDVVKLAYKVLKRELEQL